MAPPQDLLVIETDDSTVRATGEIDAHTAPALGRALDDAGPVVSLDLSGIAFIDSSGLRVLIDAHRQRVESGGSLTIRTPSEPVSRLFKISELWDYLHIEPL